MLIANGSATCRIVLSDCKFSRSSVLQSPYFQVFCDCERKTAVLVFRQTQTTAAGVFPRQSFLRENIEFMTASLLACGIDPERCILFLQSQIPEHAELSWILGCLLTTARLQHLPTLKDKTAGMKETPLGLYLYPVLQSADVLLYKATQVPVGKDQLPHIFLVQDTAELFNKRFGLVFPRPEALLVSGEAGRLRHLRDPTKKMSKSSDDPRSYVALDDPPDAVRKKIKRAITDCTSKVTYEPESRPGVANLVTLHSLLTGLSPEEVCLQAEGLDTGQFKLVVADAAVSFLEPIQQRMREHLSDRARLAKPLAQTASC
ncbi:hypothetical protein MTO96_010834 [Rhipicephalus appendiculatus]